MEFIPESTNKSIKIRKQIQIQGGSNLRCTYVAYQVPLKFVIIILVTLACFRSDSAISLTTAIRSDFLIELKKKKTNKKWEQILTLQIWLILGRSKKCLHVFPVSCLRGGILHAAVWFHLTQLVILLLWVLHCGFVNGVKSGRNVNSNLPVKRRIPRCLCRAPRRCRGASQCLESGSAAREYFMYNPISQEWQCSHTAQQALPLLGCISPLSWSLPLSPSRVSPCCCCTCAVGLCCLPRQPQPPPWCPRPCAPWVMSHPASMHGKKLLSLVHYSIMPF